MKNFYGLSFVFVAISVAIVLSETNVTPSEQCEGDPLKVGCGNGRLAMMSRVKWKSVTEVRQRPKSINEELYLYMGDRRQNFEDLRERIQVTPCGKKRCKLQKGTNTTVIFKFKPDYDVKTLINDVYAKLAGIPLPFIGVTGVSACPLVTRSSDGSPAPCPLAAGEEYTYTNVFPIESFYPTVDLTVHWALKDGDKNVICFEVPAVIAPAKKN